jgi:hypothetical protein
MSRHRSFPKDGLKKEKSIVRDLKAKLNFYIKENAFLKRELQNIMKNSRTIKEKIQAPKATFETWRQDFLKRYKEEVLDQKKKDT